MSYTLTKPEGYQKVKLPGLTAWVKALRSGEYEQGYTYLCQKDKYCCLGVLSKVQGRLVGGKDGGFGNGAGLSRSNPNYSILETCGQLPMWCKVHKQGQEPQCLLAYVNDTLHLTFPEIADILEELYEEGE